MMNEDLYGGVPNVEVLSSGLFRAIRDIRIGEELTIRYYKEYNWNKLKGAALRGLSDEVARRAPMMWSQISRDWTDLKTRRDQISRWVVKLVEGTLASLPEELHSSSNWTP